VQLITGIDLMADEIKLNCPLPLQYEQIVMAHGGGGRMMQQLIDNVIQPVFDNEILNQKHDSAVVDINGSKIAFTTDSMLLTLYFSLVEILES